jgi:hypothetical protein
VGKLAKKYTAMRYFFLLCCFLLFTKSGISQDVFFYEQSQIRGFLNPALTGINGSLSFTVLGKEQYLNTLGDFFSAGISVEQSWPCAKVDVGIFHLYDREGAGLFTTNHSGLNFVYTLPFDMAGTLNNIRIGTKFQYTYKTIDWDRLVFSDQIDPKYNLTDAFGIPNPTDFIPPDWNSSSRLTVGLGLIHKVEIGRVDEWSLTWGGAIENYTNTFEDKGYDSILRLEKDKNRLIDKWSVYLAPEFPLTRSYKDYFGLRPSLVLLSESTLLNLQLGFDINYRRAYGLGVYLSAGHFKDFGRDTRSFILNSYLRAFTTRNAQLNVGFQYVHNIGGFSEVFGQTMQVTFGYSFRQDGCGSSSAETGGCPPVSRRHRLMYENIWFHPFEGINK